MTDRHHPQVELCEITIHETELRPLPPELCSAQDIHAWVSGKCLDFARLHATDGEELPRLIHAVYENQHKAQVIELDWGDPDEKDAVLTAVQMLFNQDPPDRYVVQGEAWLSIVKGEDALAKSGFHVPPSQDPMRLDSFHVLTVDPHQLKDGPLFSCWIKVPTGNGGVTITQHEVPEEAGASFGGRLADLMLPLDDKGSEYRLRQQFETKRH